jgi:vacuolar-type H+-ATPase subunit F/Vma7
VQVAGIGNTVFGSVTGVQAGGIFNVTGKSVTGFQLAGICNFTPQMKGTQLAGISNSVWRTDGGQIAGIANTADTVCGFQIAGIANTADYIKGFQLAGIVNRAGHIDGSQIGLINVARSTTGVPFGLLSYVHDGYHKIEFATDENLLSTISLRTGVNTLHNIFLAGAQFTGTDRVWTIGYGLGTAIRLSRRFYLSADITGQQVQAMNTGNIDYNLLSKAFAGVEYRIAEKFSIAAGPTLNWLNSDTQGPDYDLVQNSLDQHAFYDETNGYFSNRVWVGGRVSIKFF